MNRQKLHIFIDWCFIMLFLICIIGTTTTPFLWNIFFNTSPLIIFIALCLLLPNHVSIKTCLQSRDKEFCLMCGGVLLSIVNMVLVRSRVGAFFTIADFLLMLYLANKVQFNKIQLGVITLTCFLIWFYWQFINKDVYASSRFNSNTPPIFMFSFFCIFISYFLCHMPKTLQIPKWSYYFIILIFIFLLAKRALDFRCRGVLLALTAWAFTYFFLPKKKQTIFLVIGFSLLFPIVYVLLWISGSMDGVTFLGKRLASGRDFIWYEFFKAFIHHPITGIGSNFDKMLPNLSLPARIVHHALLHLLYIHGIPVFLIVLYLLYKRIGEIVTSIPGFTRNACLASIYGTITLGTFENIFILSPYNIMFMIIFVISHMSLQKNTPAGTQ